MKTINDLLQEHPFFKGFSSEELLFLSSCAHNQIFNKDELLAQENTPADYFYLIRKGRVAINSNVPNQETKIIQTLGEGEIFGWSWLFEPYRWMFDALALEMTVTTVLNGKCLREKLDQNPTLGYKLMKRFSQLIIARLNATRLQLLDIYGKKGA